VRGNILWGLEGLQSPFLLRGGTGRGPSSEALRPAALCREERMSFSAEGPPSYMHGDTSCVQHALAVALKQANGSTAQPPFRLLKFCLA